MRNEKSASRVLDVIVVVLCLSGVGVSLYLFQEDLFKTLRSMSIQSVGVVTVKFNTVQRRMADRVVWDRLNTQSPVYPGDLIRIARQSGAVFNINNNYVELGENTLIRIQKDSDTPQIDFYLGSICITSEQDCGGIVLLMADQKIESAPGAVFFASVDNNGMVLQVNEGTVQVIYDGYIQSVPAGNVIIQDYEGNERLEPMALVTYPRPNARYLKTNAQSESVYFNWNRINIDPHERLRLEIAEDYNFTKIAHVIENLDSSAQVPVDDELPVNRPVYWRLSSQDAVLNSGRMTVTEAVPPVLLSPAPDANYSFRTAWPRIYFRWSEVDDIVYYILQISQTPDFNDNITAHVQGTSFIGPEIGPGKWYWRVQPVYSSVYEGRSVFSNTSVFNISQNRELQAPVLVMPASGSMINIGLDRTDISFSWSGVPEAVLYTIQISADPYLRNPAIIETVQNNYYVYGKDKNILTAGLYYWSVLFIDEDGYSSPLPQVRQFTAVERTVNQRLTFPPDNYSIEADQLRNTRFSWRTNLLHERRFQVSALPDFSILEIDEPAAEDYFQGVSMHPGNWYWRISARYDVLSPVYSAAARRFTITQSVPPERVIEPEPPVEPAPVPQIVPPVRQVVPPPPQRITQPVQTTRAAQTAPPSRQVSVQQPAEPVRAPEPVPAASREPEIPAEPVREPQPVIVRQPEPPAVIEPEPVAEPEPSFLTLRSPLHNAAIPGLTAVLQPTVFNWETGDIIGSSKFILSRRPNLIPGEVEILNPGRSVTVNSLEEGLWYWTVEAFTPEGLPFISDGPRQLRIQPIPLLSSAQNILPVRGFRFGANELRQNRTINFSWSAVDGANMYILTISKESGSSLQQIFQTEPRNSLSYTFNSLGLLEHNAVYIWQVEALFCNTNGVIIQRGRKGESFFTLDVPRPGQVQTADTGVLYGN